jgi:ATP-binding cassette, subfamily B (MDR/TAP), member 1
MFALACTAFVTGFGSKFSFGMIGENVAMRVRKELYSFILKKHIGWFDDKLNAPGVISASMASDT